MTGPRPTRYLISSSMRDPNQRRCPAQGHVSLSMDFEEVPRNGVCTRECRYAQNNNLDSVSILELALKPDLTPENAFARFLASDFRRCEDGLRHRHQVGAAPAATGTHF
jgi:hypothetical protein